MHWLRWIKELFWRKEEGSVAACQWIPNGNHGRQQRNMRNVKWIVLHATEGGAAADAVALWMASTSGESAVSAHAITDEKGACIRSVEDAYAAWTAGRANAESLQVEMVTPLGASAGWSLDTWMLKRALLDTTAKVAAEWSRRYDIPIEFVDAAGLKAGRRGITTHAEVTKAFYDGDGHFDPGKNFPMRAFLSRVSAFR